MVAKGFYIQRYVISKGLSSYARICYRRQEFVIACKFVIVCKGCHRTQGLVIACKDLSAYAMVYHHTSGFVIVRQGLLSYANDCYRIQLFVIILKEFCFGTYGIIFKMRNQLVLVAR